MDRILIRGGTPLNGSIQISGAKNAALPLLAAGLLCEGQYNLSNVPQLADITSMVDLLTQHGCIISVDGNNIGINSDNITNTTAPYDLVRRMRASILVLGPLIARFGVARVSLPGGCAIGTRPVDVHIKGLQKLGAQIELSEGYINASAPNGLVGATISMPMVSVTATENLLMAATLAKGETVLINAAREPEIIDLANCLKGMGAIIEGAGTDRIIIQGVEKLNGTSHSVIADRIETATYAIGAIITQGELTLTHTDLSLIPTVSEALARAGAIIKETPNGFSIKANSGIITGVDVITEPYPGFATDIQAQMMALMTLCTGASMITETIFENRFMHVPELARMGANITVHGSSALVRGVSQLSGAEVMATDLRASVSLVLAGLAAKGDTVLSRVYHLDRGYEKLEQKLTQCGAHIERYKVAAEA
ncbi:MAG: UDP-N-acetylglucosamine 1-carboxyvinyltransferase [Candidatus Paracaedibacteraceae bacterium]|nr:UDP-N-acetylglucosamine 1-carboxyvinyltransferase [Candidatus Paracaedibacteraceae bacterium]